MHSTGNLRISQRSGRRLFTVILGLTTALLSLVTAMAQAGQFAVGTAKADITTPAEQRPRPSGRRRKLP